MFDQTVPSRARLARRSYPVVDHAQAHVVVNAHLDVDSGCPGVTGHVAERLSQGGQELGGHPVVDAGVQGPVQQHPRLEAQGAGRLPDEGEQLLAKALVVGPLVLEAEDRRADVLDREVEVVDGALDPAACRGGIGIRPAGRCPASDMPVANSRWITVSWRSRAMRSRSSTRASSWSFVCKRAFSIATPAAAARPTTSSSSTSVKTSADYLSVR